MLTTASSVYCYRDFRKSDTLLIDTATDKDAQLLDVANYAAKTVSALNMLGRSLHLVRGWVPMNYDSNISWLKQLPILAAISATSNVDVWPGPATWELATYLRTAAMCSLTRLLSSLHFLRRSCFACKYSGSDKRLQIFIAMAVGLLVAFAGVRQLPPTFVPIQPHFCERAPDGSRNISDEQESTQTLWSVRFGLSSGLPI
nr:unnamed protein product [Spirometra erinaceieuropaei]